MWGFCYSHTVPNTNKKQTREVRAFQGTQKQPHEAKGRSIRVAGGVQFQHAMLQSCLQDQKIHVSPARKGFREEPHGTEIGLKPNLHALIIGSLMIMLSVAT